jgi:hypothetical protein
MVGGHLEHDPEKACRGLDPGWQPVFGKHYAQAKIQTMIRFN